jgi:hypothetical protein
MMFTSSGEKASQSKPAKFVVFLVKDKGATLSNTKSETNCQKLGDETRVACRSSILRSPNHVGYIFVRIYELQLHPGMTPCEDSKDFVCKCLPDLIDVPEIKYSRAKPVDAKQQPLRLRPGNQIVFAMLSHFHRHDRPVERIVILWRSVSIIDFLA